MISVLFATILAATTLSAQRLTSTTTLLTTTTRTLRRVLPKDCERRGKQLLFRHRFPRVSHSFYLRLRGTNTSVDVPQLDPPDVDPWGDLWFYGNPIFVIVKG